MEIYPVKDKPANNEKTTELPEWRHQMETFSA